MTAPRFTNDNDVRVGSGMEVWKGNDSFRVLSVC
jgi:hypothetical protein